MAKVTGREAIMRILKREEVEYVFGLPGTTEVHFMDALEDHPEIKYILGLHESSVVGMAEGYSRISGKVGVVNLHTLAGLAAATPALVNACGGGVPLLVTAGQQDTRLHLQEPQLGGDLTGLASHFTKWSTEISYAADIPIAMRRAFKVAMTPPTGPVFVSLPTNIMEEEIDLEYDPGIPVFMKLHPDPEAVAAAVKLLAGAKKPMMMVGAGVAKNDAVAEVVTLAELTGAPVYQAWMADVNFPTSHPQYLGGLAVGSPAVTEMLKSVDVLVVVGSSLFTPSFYLPEPILTPNTKVIHIDDNTWEIAKNLPVTAGIAGHIKASIAELNEALSQRMTAAAQKAAKDRAAAIAGEKTAMKTAFAEKVQQERDQVPIAASRLMQEIRDAVKPGTIIVDEGVSNTPLLQRVMDFDEPMSYLMMRGGGSIGCGLPTAIGAKLAAPERPVVCLSGDGAALWSIQSLWTAANHHLPITFVIYANAGYAMLKISKGRIFGKEGEGRYLGMKFTEPRIDFQRLAQGLGIAAQRVEKPEKLGDALRLAFNADEPNLVEVRLADAF